MKKLLVLLLVAAMVFSFAACGSGADEGEASQFSDVRVIFFPGGSEGGTFASVVYNGAAAAQKDLGCQVDYMWSDWQSEKMIAQLKEAIALNPDGIAIMGHPGDAAYSSIIDEAMSKGIIITSQNTTLPENEAKYKDKGFGYVGQELYASGVMLSKGAAKRAGLQSGDRVMVWGLLSQEGRGDRTKGCIDALEELGMIVDYIEISDEINADAALGTPVIASYVASNPDVKMIVADHGNLTAIMGTYLKGANKNPGDIFGAGFDLSAATAAAIRDGWVGAVLDQQPWLQGYLPVLQICLAETYGFSGLHIDTGAAIIDAATIEFIAPLAEAGVR